MNDLNLSPDARRRLWQCYSLLLSLADEADENSITDADPGEAQEATTATESNELTRLDDGSVEVELEEVQIGEHPKSKPAKPETFESRAARG